MRRANKQEASDHNQSGVTYGAVSSERSQTDTRDSKNHKACGDRAEKQGLHPANRGFNCAQSRLTTLGSRRPKLLEKRSRVGRASGTQTKPNFIKGSTSRVQKS